MDEEEEADGASCPDNVHEFIVAQHTRPVENRRSNDHVREGFSGSVGRTPDLCFAKYPRVEQQVGVPQIFFLGGVQMHWEVP